MLHALKSDNPKLRERIPDIQLSKLRTNATQAQIEALLDFVYRRNNKGEKSNRSKPTVIGLSANQVGVMERICIVDLAVRKIRFSDVHVMINPKITWYSKSKAKRREGCVNLPNIWGHVDRASAVDVSFLDRWGNTYQMRAHGWAAILIQHEVDHLNGKLFIDWLEDPTKAQLVGDKDLLAYKKDPKAWKKFVDVTKLRKPI